MKIMLCLILVMTSVFFSCKKESNEYIIPDYKGWRKPVDKVLETPVPGHGATFRIIYANDIAFSSTIQPDNSGRKRVIMKEGSVVVKEVYAKKSDIGRVKPMLTIMAKDSTSVHSVNGWKYILKKTDSSPVFVTGRMCVGCHEAANEKHPYFDGNEGEMFRDYLFIRIAR